MPKRDASTLRRPIDAAKFDPRFGDPRGCVNPVTYLRLAHVRVGLRKRLQRADMIAVTVIEYSARSDAVAVAVHDAAGTMTD